MNKRVRILCRKQHASETESHSKLSLYEADFRMPVRYCELDCDDCEKQCDRVIEEPPYWCPSCHSHDIRQLGERDLWHCNCCSKEFGEDMNEKPNALSSSLLR